MPPAWRAGSNNKQREACVEMNALSAWILGVIMGLVSLFGLFLASNAVDQAFYWTGLLFFIFGVLFIFALIGRRTAGSGDEDSQ